MKLGRKGFMLAEVVVVAVVIATVLVTLYVGLNNMSSAYETRNKYYDVDSLYIAMEINDILIRENSINSFDKNNVTLLSDYVSNFESFYENNIKYNITSYFVPYKSSEDGTTYTLQKGIDKLKSMVVNSTFKDYIDYLSGNLIFDDDYDYIIIVERENINDEDDCYYYALKLKF